MTPLLDELARARGVKPRILVVDDQPLNLRLVHDIFRSDYEVFAATGGVQALEKCPRLMPDLILLDVMMPDLDGHAVCRRLKEDPLTAGIPVIFLTAQHDEADEVAGFQLGAVDFIIKPINAVIVKVRVDTHLAMKLQTDALKSIALIDGLTGIANRRRFDNDFLQDWKQCVREQQPISTLLIDVDFFKRYNDHYGHLRGDDCLRQVAQAVRGELKRPYDLVARYGGEEFVCLLPNTPKEGALALGWQICDAVRRLDIEHKRSDAASCVTVSVGAATLQPGLDDNPPMLLGLADARLYEAKQHGRARVVAG